MKLNFNEKQAKVLLFLIEKELKNYSNDEYREELIQIQKSIVKANSYDGIIEEFVDKYKYENESASFNDKEYNIGLLIEGIDYQAHWKKGDDRFYLNNFIVDYKAIINAIDELNDDNNIFKTEDYYRQLYKDFTVRLKEIGVVFAEDTSDEYDVLMIYSLPTDKILDEKFIKSFTNILSDYMFEFKKELDFIYGIY